MPLLPPGVSEIKQAGRGTEEPSEPDASGPFTALGDENSQPKSFSTPHDAILADLHGYNRVSSAEPSSIAPRSDALNLPTPQLTNPYSNALFSAQSPTSERLLDPFTGAHIGDQLDEDELDENSNSKMEEDMWSHLSQILKLQSVIAEKHVKMEGIGLKKPGASRGKSKGPGVPRRSSTNIGKRWEQGADVDDEADEEAQRKSELEAEFAGLGDKFTWRKDAIDGIMKNLEELSSAVTTFHALRTPTIKFPSASCSSGPSAESRRESQLSSPLSQSQQGPSSPGAPPYTSLSAPAALSPTTAKPTLARLLPVHDEHPPPVVDSPVSMNESIPEGHH
ncbi:hypothetical protein HWV62_18688 [Athelia sp. TMB]|nr:hypothetical protein HWV62_18688 [Athelia sp. TMB]